jgi:hypothetical protein
MPPRSGLRYATTMPEYTNLLPPEREHALKSDYRTRLVVVALWLISALTLGAGALLIPTYLLLAQQEGIKSVQLASLTAKLSSSDEVALAQRLAALSENASRLTDLGKDPSISNTLREMLAIAHVGAALTALDYTPGDGKQARVVKISGTAASRNALRNYQLALEGSPLVASASLPVSAYAKDTDIPFTIVVTLKP